MVNISIVFINFVVGREYLSAAIRKKLKVKYCWLIEYLRTTHEEIDLFRVVGVKENKVPRKKLDFSFMSQEQYLCPEANKYKSGPKGQLVGLLDERSNHLSYNALKDPLMDCKPLYYHKDFCQKTLSNGGR